MKANVGGIDKIVRIVLGVGLIAWAALLDGPKWAYIGVLPLLTGVYSFCPMYRLLGMSTCKANPGQ